MVSSGLVIRAFKVYVLMVDVSVRYVRWDLNWSELYSMFYDANWRFRFLMIVYWLIFLVFSPSWFLCFHLNKHGIVTIIDLRSPSEMANPDLELRSLWCIFDSHLFLLILFLWDAFLLRLPFFFWITLEAIVWDGIVIMRCVFSSLLIR